MSTKPMASKYTQDGVDVEEGDDISSYAARLCASTNGNSRFIQVLDLSSHFRGPKGFITKGLPEGYILDFGPDGDGTKPELIVAAGDFVNAARGFVAMTVDDIGRWGGIPLMVTNTLDAKSLGKKGDVVNTAFRTMLYGLRQLTNELDIVMYKGETAELPGCVTSPDNEAILSYLWSGVAFGAYNPKTLITGDNIREGMLIMALKENGFRNNGISSVRAALRMRFGEFSNPNAQESIKQAAAPAVIYSKFWSTVNGWFAKNFEPVIPSHLNVHLTGGAFGKLADDILFTKGLSAHLNDLWEPATIVKNCAKWRGMSDMERYKTWGCGQGALSVIDPRFKSAYIDLAASFGVEAKVAGIIIRKTIPTLSIVSKFTGDMVEWSAE